MKKIKISDTTVIVGYCCLWFALLGTGIYSVLNYTSKNNPQYSEQKISNSHAQNNPETRDKKENKLEKEVK